MSGYVSLLRLAQHQAELRQKTVLELAAAKAEAGKRRQKILADVEAERVRASRPDVHYDADVFAAYLDGARMKCENIEHSIAQLEEEETAARAALQEAFEEVKKYEILTDREAARKREEGARREAAALDEIATTRASRAMNE